MTDLPAEVSMSSGTSLLSFLSVAYAISISSVFATEYTVDVGVDTRGGRDAQTLECMPGNTCSAKLEPFKLKIDVHVSRRNSSRVLVSMRSDQPGCCYFDDAVRSIWIDLEKNLSLPIYEGQQARGGLFIENERVGFLYFRFTRR
jgi:hypothetical protein